MKKLNILTLFLSSLIILSSCSSEESFIPADQSAGLLKKYKLKRDTSGAYSIDFDLNKNVRVDKVVNPEDNSNQFLLYSGNNNTNKSISEDLLIDTNQLKVGFVDTNIGFYSNVSITDDNINFLSKNDTPQYLDTYEVYSNEDGTFGLDFKTKDNVAVDFVYNENDSAYEIHLEMGNSKDNNYSRVLEQEEDKSLKIYFVNHSSNQAKSSSVSSPIRKPIIIIDHGEEGEN